MNIYIICSVRNAPQEETDRIIGYAEMLEAEGNEVRCPPRDTHQEDDIGLRIVEEHEGDIVWADEAHCILNPTSEGSRIDAMQMRMAGRLIRGKRFRIVNLNEVSPTFGEDGRLIKSYHNVLIATHLGLCAGVTADEFLEALATAQRAFVPILSPLP